MFPINSTSSTTTTVSLTETALQILNLCCSLYLAGEERRKRGNSVVTFEENNGSCHKSAAEQLRRFSNSTTDDCASVNCFPKVSSCCSLQLARTEYDVFGSPYLIYTKRSSTTTVPVDPANGSHHLHSAIIDPVPLVDFEDIDYSEYNFINIIWLVREPWEVVIKTVATIPIVVIAVIGNVAIIYLILNSKQLRNNPVNLFILNMSIADLISSISFSTFFLVYDFYQRFVLGGLVCEYEGCLFATLMLTSVLSLTVISADRLLAVVFPFQKRMNTKVAKLIIYCIWLISAGISYPLAIWRKYRERQWKDFNEAYCTEYNREGVQTYWFLLLALLVLLPLTAMVISYVAIIIKLSSLEKKPTNNNNSSSTSIKSKAKVVKMFFIVIVVFTLCWLPFTILTLHRFRLKLEKISSMIPIWFEDLLFVSHYLILLNSALNPIIYGLKNENLKRGFRQLIPSCCRRQKKVEISTIGGGGKNTANNYNNLGNNHYGGFGGGGGGMGCSGLGFGDGTNNGGVKTATTGITNKNINLDNTKGVNSATQNNGNAKVENDASTPSAGTESSSTILQQLFKKRKYTYDYDNIIQLGEPSLEKASLSSFERRDSALADLGLPVPPAPPPLISGVMFTNNLN